MVDQLMAELGIDLKELDLLAFAQGPGAFTGVRLCTSIAQGLAYASELPVIGISSLATMAQGCRHEAKLVFSAIDARMGEIYWGLFDTSTGDCVSPLCPEAVSKVENIRIKIEADCFGCGTAWGKYQQGLSGLTGTYLSASNAEYFPRARHILPLAIEKFQQGETVRARQAMPVYLRNKVTG